MKPSSKDAYARLLALKSVVVHALATPPKDILSELYAQWSDEDREKADDDFRAAAERNVAMMREFGLWKYTSPNEQVFLQSSGSQMDDSAHKAAGWRMECAGMMMWALRLIEEWPKIDVETDIDLLKQLSVQKLGLFSRFPTLRPHPEISAKRDLIELWHWRVRTRWLIEEGSPFEPTEGMKKAGLHTFDDIVRMSATSGYERGDLPEIIEEDFVFMGKPFRSLPHDEYQIATSIIMERHYALNWLCGMAPGNRWDDTLTDT